MPLSWNEIKTRAIAFSQEWEHQWAEKYHAADRRQAAGNHPLHTPGLGRYL